MCCHPVNSIAAASWRAPGTGIEVAMSVPSRSQATWIDRHWQ
jgi:hypothetical protein